MRLIEQTASAKAIYKTNNIILFL